MIVRHVVIIRNCHRAHHNKSCLISLAIRKIGFLDCAAVDTRLASDTLAAQYDSILLHLPWQVHDRAAGPHYHEQNKLSKGR